MAIKFEFYESPNTIGTRKKRYHARVVNWQRINTDYLARTDGILPDKQRADTPEV